MKSPRQRLGALTQHAPARRADQQKAPRPALGIDFRAQRGEDFRQRLHFVEHHQPSAMAREEGFWLGESRPLRFALQVEHQRVGILGR